MPRFFDELGHRLMQRSPHTNTYGLARSLLALATLLNLLGNPMSRLFSPAAGLSQGPQCADIANAGLFCLVSDLELAKWVAIVALGLVATGWRPRITGVLHWWVTTSFHLSATLTDGGDQVASVLTLLLIPVCLSDGRRWHWPAPTQGEAEGQLDAPARIIGGITLRVIAFQVAFIYLHASVAKLGVQEWADGTVMYYWFTHPTFGLPSWAESLGTLVASSGLVVAALTWGALAVEFCLFLSIALDQRRRQWLFLCGLMLHVSIGLLMGLVSFSIAMIAALILLLKDPTQPLRFGWFKRASEVIGRQSRKDLLNGSRLTRPAEVPR